MKSLYSSACKTDNDNKLEFTLNEELCFNQAYKFTFNLVNPSNSEISYSFYGYNVTRSFTEMETEEEEIEKDSEDEEEEGEDDIEIITTQYCHKKYENEEYELENYDNDDDNIIPPHSVKKFHLEVFY